MSTRYSPNLAELIDALRCLPGVGQKSAQRAAFHLLQRDRQGARRLSSALAAAEAAVCNCEQCRMFAEESLCVFCQAKDRQESQLCVVEGPADVMAIEEGAGYRGRYFVLMGHLSPLDGIGPEEIGLDLLGARLDSGEISELIIATNATVEGEATAHYLAEMARARGIGVSRIAQGIPRGGELEYVDGGTLSQAIAGRQAL